MSTVGALLLLTALAGVLPGEEKTMMVTSPAFESNSTIPAKHAYKGEGKNVSPPLAWTGAPAGARQLALVCDDPDAPRATPWVHWVLYGLPGDLKSLPEGSIPHGAVEGKNDFGENGWGGPMPPRGDKPHHYRFHLYALDAPVSLGSGATKDQLLSAIRGHVLAEGELVGLYKR